jgi:hypothetical protein
MKGNFPMSFEIVRKPRSLSSPRTIKWKAHRHCQKEGNNAQALQGNFHFNRFETIALQKRKGSAVRKGSTRSIFYFLFFLKFILFYPMIAIIIVVGDLFGDLHSMLSSMCVYGGKLLKPPSLCIVRPQLIYCRMKHIKILIKNSSLIYWRR